jgi:hypothetical protein
MANRYRFIYTRESGVSYRGFEPLAVIRYIVREGTYRNRPVTFIRWQTGNYDFTLERPRVEGRELALSEVWYRAEWEPIDTSNLPIA